MSVTTDPVERLFSVAGQVVTAKRNRLSPETVTLLVFLHESLPVFREIQFKTFLDSVVTPWTWTGMCKWLMIRDPSQGVEMHKDRSKG